MIRSIPENAARIDAAVLDALQAHGPHPISQKALELGGGA